MTFCAGIDIGSVTTKCVILKDGSVAGQALARTGADAESSVEIVFAAALQKALVARDGLAAVVTTGYGRRLFPKADRSAQSNPFLGQPHIP